MNLIANTFTKGGKTMVKEDKFYEGVVDSDTCPECGHQGLDWDSTNICHLERAICPNCDAVYAIEFEAVEVSLDVAGKFPRYCTVCNKGMFDGWCLGEGQEYLCEKCMDKLAIDWVKQRLLDQDSGYWTDWNDPEYLTEACRHESGEFHNPDFTLEGWIRTEE